MPTKTKLANKLSNQFIEHELNLLRLEAGERRKILLMLRKLEAQLEAKIDTFVGRETFTQARAKALIANVTETIGTAYGEVYRDHRDALVRLGMYETAAITKIVNTVVKANVFTVGVPESVIKSMLDDKTVLGVPLKSFWSRRGATLRDNFITQMRQGLYAGETTDQLVRRVRGTKANNFQDGLMRTERAAAETIVRTSGQSVLNDARMEVFEANADVLNGVQVLAVLDDRTSAICIARSGEAWDMEGNPLEGTDTDEDFPGPPPWHPNCRSTLIPIVKSIGDILGTKALDKNIKREARKIPEATQASMDGQVSQHLTYEQWLQTKSTDFQKEVLGEGRYQLWQKDRISLRDLIDQRGRPLSLDQLKSLEA